MRWIQWAGRIKLSRIHATTNGRLTLCGTLVPHPLTLDSQNAPRSNNKSVCKFCKRAEEEGRRYQ